MGCDLTSGDRDLPGDRVHETRHWVVEHCIGPLGVGTLVLKPLRHCVHVSDLTEEEAAELGPLLRTVSRCVEELNEADQVYVCLWSHAGWVPGHIHFVVQPSWNRLRDRYSKPGPTIQVEMFREDVPPPREEVEAFCDRARRWPGWTAGSP
jgi:diadenosine tetraphosphate (Ap4A) HIT family hydrolase